MQNTLLSPIPLDELRNLISESVKVEVEKISSLYKPTNQTELITREETSQLLGISLPTLNSWTKLGVLPSYRIATRVRYKREEVLNSVSKVESIKYGRV
jgi:excisionase family DNA binding protein